jgi:hypothetical protein
MEGRTESMDSEIRFNTAVEKQLTVIEKIQLNESKFISSQLNPSTASYRRRVQSY